MTDKKRPYRSSIWTVDKEYSISRRFTTSEFRIISRLLAVNVAKMTVPIIAPANLLEISKRAKMLVRVLSRSNHCDRVKKQNVAKFLDDSLAYRGAGILTVICILAVVSDGEYPPMDRYVANGLLSKKKITEIQKKKLLAKSNEDFADVYVGKVIPAWRQERKNRTPQEIDDFWGAAGKKRLAKENNTEAAD